MAPVTPVVRAGRGRGVMYCSWGLLVAEAQDLFLPAAVPVDGDALEAQLKGHEVDLPHVVLGGLLGEVHRLGDGVVGVFLEGGLEADVPLGRDVVGGDEDPSDVLRDLLESRMEPVVAIFFMRSAL